MALKFKPIVLIVLDGFGIAPPNDANAISLAKKPFFDSLINEYPLNLLEASGLNVGLPQGEVGNSEVGHVTIGSGILKYQSLPRINRFISTGEFFKLPALMAAAKKIKKGKGKLHIMGLIGNGGVHASQDHLQALISFVREKKINDKTYLHLFTDGRDTAKDVGKIFMEDTIKLVKQNKIGGIATMSGRFYAMDRNKNWDRTAKAYNAIVKGESEKTHKNPLKAIKESYKNKIYDEEIEPHVFLDKKNQPITTVDDNDIIIFFNFRADRAKQLTQAITDPKFDKFETIKFKKLEMITFTEYDKDFPVKVLFPIEIIKNPLAKIFSDLNLKQLHIAETEKYAHVTFFLNGMTEASFANENRILIPSPDVSTYDQKPQMSAEPVTQEILKALKSDKYDFIAINYANPDMVGHTGNLKATISAIETVDKCLAKIIPVILKKGGSIFVVGDHGNSEELINPITGEIDKEHNVYPIPFLVMNNKLAGQPNPDIIKNDISLITPIGILADIAPTLLKVSGLKIPKEMTGQSLL
jgi:2,3-bisphosphoglycerate-independent phosphoglycerate mutase